MVELKSFIGEKLKIKEMMGRKMSMEPKQTHQQFAGRHPGCMWGVLHVLKYQRWRYIKKRLPYSRPSFAAPQHSTPMTGGIDEEAAATSEANHTRIETQPPALNNAADSTASNSGVDPDKPTKSIKSSVRSRLKSLISDELYRKKGNHHRRNHTCPVPQQQQQQQQNHHHEQEAQQLSFDNVTLPPSSVPHKQGEDNESENHEHGRDSKSSSRKEVPEEQDMNKEFMATILQDPNSHFSPQFTTHKRYSKSVSFPSTTLKKEPPRKQVGKEVEGFDAKKLGNHHPVINSTPYKRSRSLSAIVADYKLEGIPISTLKPSIAAASLNDTSKKESSGRNKTAMRRLKDLKQKIRHVITMEAVLHKIPRGSGSGSSHAFDFSKDKSSSNKTKEGGSNNDIVVSPRKSYAGDCGKFVLASKTDNQILKRTSSLCESLDKYCQLYESTFNNRDSKKNLIVDDDPTDMSDQTAEVNDETTTPKVVKPDVEEPEETKEVSPSSTSDDVSEENKHDVAKHTSPFSDEECNDDGMFIPQDTSFIHEDAANSHPPFSTFKDSEQILRNLIANKLHFLEDQRAESIIDEIIEAEEELDKKQELESKNNTSCYEVIDFQVDDCKEKEKFDYVKGILDISGFSQKEFLGAWHSNEQPLDPAVFEEAGGDNHLAMFDLINEVLMDIYAKSHTYCPKALSWLSHIKPMPIGSHVLKEVWGNMKWSLSAIPDENEEHLLDFLVGRDFEKSDGWMNLQFDCECVGLELEDWIFDDILDELVFEDDPRGSIFL